GALRLRPSTCRPRCPHSRGSTWTRHRSCRRASTASTSCQSPEASLVAAPSTAVPTAKTKRRASHPSSSSVGSARRTCRRWACADGQGNRHMNSQYAVEEHSLFGRYRFFTGRLPPALDSVARVQFEQLWNMHPTQSNEILIYGRMVPIPRWQQAYG